MMIDHKSLAIIDKWPLFGLKRKHAQHIAKQYRALGEEVSGLLEQIEKLTPPEQSTGIIPVGDHVRALKERDAIIEELQREVTSLQRKRAEDPTAAAAIAKNNIGGFQQ
jgi:DNA-binding ferritin-like protein